MIKNVTAGLLLVLCLIARAQQPEIYNQFYMNPYLYNPAYAGVEGHSVLFAMYHQQWANIENAPRMVHASFHMPLEGGLGIGAAAFNYSQGLLTKNVGKVSASYLLTLDLKHYIRFGLSVGGGTQSIAFGELDDPTDPAFLNTTDNNSFAVADFGVSYHFDHFNVGISLPNLVSYDIFQGEDFAPVNVRPQDNAIFKMNYRGHINDDLAIEPHLLYRYSKFTPDQYEATVILHLYHIVWVGGTYRQDNNFIATVGTKIKEKIGIGYAYELGNSSIANLLGPTHEIHIGYHLQSHRDHHAHTSSFIKSHQKSAEERAKEAAQERERKLQALQETRPIEEDEELDIVETPEPPKEVSDWEVDSRHQPVDRVNEFGEKEKAVIVEHENEAGETEYAIAWRPVDENWVLVKDEKPNKRETSDGGMEVGIKYITTDDYGREKQIIKWEPVLTEQQLESVLSGETAPEDVALVEPAETSDWEIDREHQPIERESEGGKEEEALIVDHINEQGEKEYAMAWRPVDEDWEMLTDKKPEKRTLPSGQKEVGIRYRVTEDDGSTREIVQWEPVLTAEQLEELLTPMQESDWEIDREHEPITRKIDGDAEERAFIVDHINEQGVKEYALAWRPVGEDWEMVTEEKPKKRIAPDGEREVGIKYIVTGSNGQKKEIVKWEPVLTESELEEILTPEPASDWEVDREHVPITRETEGEAKEEAFIVDHVNEQGVKEYALAWRPVDENWEMITDEKPQKRIGPDGEPEVGIKYVVTGDDGQKKEKVVWEPVLSEQELDSILEKGKKDEAGPIVIENKEEMRDILDDEPEDDEPIFNKPEDDEGHDTVTGGDNMLELPKGNYVVAGAFEDFDNAENFSDELFQKGYHETIVGYVSQYGLYYVVIHRSSELSAAKAFQKRVKERRGMNEIWVLKVN